MTHDVTVKFKSVKALTHDGPVTPEQLALFIPGAFSASATATCRYRIASGTWKTGHNLHRIVPDYAETPALVDAGFAWTIFGLAPGTAYEVEVTVTDGGSTVYSGTLTTRSLPAAAGAATTTFTTSDSEATIQAALDAASPGDVFEFAAGTYNVALVMRASGTAGSPIYVRGASRTATILQDDARPFYFTEADYVILENMTLQGSGVDSGIDASSVGVLFWSEYAQNCITVRNCIITGVDMGVCSSAAAVQTLVYDCTLTGNNTWTQDYYAYNGSGAPGAGDETPDVDQNVFWNDDGIRLSGTGGCAFNNTLSGFGDALCLDHNQVNSGIHFYRNDVLMTGDDSFEADYCKRNVTFYDNRLHNAMTFVSCDPCIGGPLIVARNAAVNMGRTPLKLNNTNTGHFFYNNTIVRAANTTSDYGWLQNNNGDQRAWGYQNNILIYGGSSEYMIYYSPSLISPVDLSHNVWYPDTHFYYSNNPSSNSTDHLAQAQALSSTGVFSAYETLHVQDSIAEDSNPFAGTITVGADYHTEVAINDAAALAIDPASTSCKNTGLVIAGVTDGYTGAAPDRGAIIAGRAVPVWGDRSASLPAGSGWHELTDTKIETVCAVNDYPELNGNTGGAAIVTAWNSAVFDSLRNRLLVWGGGHLDYFGNEVYALNLMDNPPTMVRLKQPTLPPATGTPESLGSDPNARHTYDGIGYIVGQDKMFAVGGSLSVGGNASTALWLLDMQTLAWQLMDPSGTDPQARYGIVTAFDSNTGKVFLHDTYNLRVYDPGADSYSLLAADTYLNIYGTGVVDPVREKLVIIGGGEEWEYDISSDSSYVQTDLATTNGSTIVDSDSPGLAYCPDNDKIVAWNGGNTVYLLDMDTKAWSTVTYSDGPGAAPPAGTYKRWAYSESLQCFVLVNAWNQNAFIFRL